MSARPRLGLLDYGAGNLASVEKALAYVGFEVVRARSAHDAERIHALVIPGVGHYSATGALMDGFRATIDRAFADERPVLGICLGLQVLFEGSDESPNLPGLGLLSGRCFRLSGNVKVPHVGWNTIAVRRRSPLLAGIDGAAAYFTHSFAAPVTDATAGVTTHGVTFASVVSRGVVFGVQWHPEKSGETGLTLLRNFREVCASC